MAEDRQKKLVLTERRSQVEEAFLAPNAVEILAAKADPGAEYQVLVHCVNELKMGWYRDGGLVFADGSGLADEHLLQLRAFNDDMEILVKKAGHDYWVRKIDDTCGAAVKTVDSTSRIFGKKAAGAELPADFAMVFEPGRKVKLVLPVKDESSEYCVTTRSYVTYDEKTGQAGYGYYRYVAIEAERR